jgi:hypothetical protein
MSRLNGALSGSFRSRVCRPHLAPSRNNRNSPATNPPNIRTAALTRERPMAWMFLLSPSTGLFVMACEIHAGIFEKSENPDHLIPQFS